MSPGLPFAPGKLTAVGKNGSQIVARDTLQTAGAPTKILLSTETTKLAKDYDSVAVVRAKIVDADGLEIPRAHDLITFHVSGSGVIAAVDNGDNPSLEPFQAASRHAYQGECVAFVKASAASGKITLTASADGLADGKVTIKASPELSR